MEKREFKDKVFGELSRISSALANPKRLEIIDLLAQGERTVEKIAQETSMSTANASQHLQVLKNSNLVEIKRNGNFIIYKISDKKVVMIWQLLREFGTERIAEVEKVVKDFRAQKKVFESVTIEELLKKMKLENVVVLDVRPEEEYQAGHIAHALSIPIDKLSERLKELPKNKEIIAYCRGPFCVFADDAIQLLLKNKFKAKRLEEGFPDWKLKGLPVEVIN
jgi:rhodanese-related sulfurtransferase/DNA-binding transcriptional ArsR family regulator